MSDKNKEEKHKKISPGVKRDPNQELLVRQKELETQNKELLRKMMQAEESLKMHIEKDELNYHALFETMTEGVALHQMIYDARGNAVDYLIKDVNSSFEKNLGIPAEKAKGSLGSKLYSASSPPYLEIYEQVVKTGTPYYFKTYYPPMNRHFEISIFTPRKDFFATIFLDVTGFHNSQEELRKAKKEASFLSYLVENSSQPFTISSLDGHIGRVNHAFTLLTGYRKEELSTMHWSQDLSPREWFEKDAAKSQELLETGLPVRYEKEYLHKSGQRIQVEIFKHLVKDDKGQPDFFYSFVTDISIRKKAEEDLKNLNKVLEEKVAERTTDLEMKVHELNKSQTELLYMVEDLNRTSQKLKNTQEELVRKERLAILGEFSGNISHELRNPLSVIDSSIYFLKMKLNDKDEKTLQHLDRISNSVKTSISIIENLLNLTRMNKPVLTSYDCITLISECLNSCAIPSKVKVVKHFTDDPITILAENVQFQMIVNNLVKNAITAMNGDGTITIKIHKIQEEQVEISFTDSGSGIGPADLEKVFQPLYSTKAKGFGLGLSITKMIVENHGGKIFVESALVKGSRFIMHFPAKNEKREVKNDFPMPET